MQPYEYAFNPRKKKCDLTPAQVEKMFSTSLRRGAIDPLVYRMVPQYVPPGSSLLDFGAGSKSPHTAKFLQMGYDAVAYDQPEWADETHDPNALDYTYPYVLASNVMNVQPNAECLEDLVNLFYELVQPGGYLIANYPKDPRYAPYTPAQLRDYIEDVFGSEAVQIAGQSSYPVWMIQKA